MSRRLLSDDVLREQRLREALGRDKTASKYRNVRCEASDGRKFQSMAERDRYEILRVAEKAGAIEDLRCQVAYPLQVGDVVIGRYVADFVYTSVDGDRRAHIVEDVKGLATQIFRWKARHFKAQYGYEITVWRKRSDPQGKRRVNKKNVAEARARSLKREGLI